jgi:hypothetical protein
VKDSKKLLDVFVIVEVGWFEVDPSLLSKMEMFIKKECVVEFCALERVTLFHIFIYKWLSSYMFQV